MVKVTKIVEKSLKPKGGKEPGEPKGKKNTSSDKSVDSNKKKTKSENKADGPLISKLGPYEQKKKVEKVEFSDKLGQLFGVDPSDINETT